MCIQTRVLQTHLDKEGGSQAAFLCLSQAYEVLSDAGQWSVSLLELQRLKSQDGQNFKSAHATRDGGLASAEEAAASPEMLSEAFLGIQWCMWPPLLKILSNQNLFVLA